MRKIVLALGVWIMSMSFVSATNDPASFLPFGSNILLVSDQDAPVYPNPARDHIFFRLNDVSMSSEGDLAIEIRNILGNKMPVRMERTSNNTYRISLNNYPSGYYLLVLQCDRCSSESGRHEEIHKFLKQ